MASCSSSTNSLGLCACSILPGPQTMLGIPACWRRGRQLFKCDVRPGVRAAHLRHQRALGIIDNFPIDRARIDTRQIAKLESEFAQRGNRVDRDAAVDHPGLRGGEGHVERLVERTVLLVLLGQVVNEANQACRIFNRVHSAGRQGRMRGMAMNPALVGVDALVRDDHAHAGRLTDDAAVRPHAALGEVGDHRWRAGAADFLVIRKREVQRVCQARLLD
jgi:hypothetical protein